MRKTFNLLYSLFLISLLGACEKACDASLRIGEMVQIPIVFAGFSISEIENIQVYRIDNSGSSPVDTFLLREILWANSAQSNTEMITDREPSKSQGQFGYYDSYFNGCTLILDWNTGKDTLKNFEILKSQENIKGCHENDPNVKIDKLSFIHKGKVISKGESIQIGK